MRCTTAPVVNAASGLLTSMRPHVSAQKLAINAGNGRIKVDEVSQGVQS